MQMTWQSCTARYTKMADSRGHSKSRHGNPIHIFTEVETDHQGELE